VEFFAETNTSNGCQTLFEITNNESASANLYTKTRFLTVIENGNLNAYAIQIVAPFIVGGHVSNITTPIPIASNDKIFYNGELLAPNQYSVSGSHLHLSNIAISSTSVLTEIGQVLFEVLGGLVTVDVSHFISAERYQNQFYLFLDGVSQSAPVAAYNAIPAQVITNSSNINASLQRYGSPALLTIGANRDGKNQFLGMFGDVKIINGVSEHVTETEIQNTISSLFTDANLGTQPADIIIDGGHFVDSITSYAPEEFVPGQIFDTLYMQVYQSDTANANSNIMSFALFKPIIMAGPTGYYEFTIESVNQKITLPWTSLDAAASIKVNGNAISSTSWAVTDSVLTIAAGPGDFVQMYATGPTTYYAIGANTVSTLTSNLYANSNSISVANTDPFITPIIGSTANISNNALLNVRGQVFVNQECITYLYIDRTGNTLSGLMRGTSGTGVPNVHISGARVVSASYNNNLQNLTFVDPRTNIWYTYPPANTSLQNTNSVISSTLLSIGGLPPVTPF
jgi:hypothetical protein